MKSLLEEGVTTIFGHPSGIFFYPSESPSEHPFRYILCRHEQVAAHAAEGYYKATGRTGTVMVTSGPGATNCVTAITDALVDSMAIVVLSGQMPAGIMGGDVAQEADVVGTTRACTKYNFLALKAEDIPRIIKEAYYIARSGRPGPVLVDILSDVMIERAEFQDPAFPVIANATGRPYEADKVRETLALQIGSAVRWLDSMLFLLDQGVANFEEVGPGSVLTKLIAQIKKRSR